MLYAESVRYSIAIARSANRCSLGLLPDVNSRFLTVLLAVGRSRMFESVRRLGTYESVLIETGNIKHFKFVIVLGRMGTVHTAKCGTYVQISAKKKGNIKPFSSS